MKIWITRPDLASVVIRGVSECTAWLVKPIYDMTTRGEEDSLFPDKEKGWAAMIDGSPARRVSTPIGKTFRPYPELTRALIRAIHESVGETIAEGAEFDEWPASLDRWNAIWHAVEPCTYDDPRDGRKQMCLELDVPWQLWIKLANNAANSDVERAQWLMSLNPAEIPF